MVATRPQLGQEREPGTREWFRAATRRGPAHVGATRGPAEARALRQSVLSEQRAETGSESGSPHSRDGFLATGGATRHASVAPRRRLVGWGCRGEGHPDGWAQNRRGCRAQGAH